MNYIGEIPQQTLAVIRSKLGCSQNYEDNHKEQANYQSKISCLGNNNQDLPVADQANSSRSQQAAGGASGVTIFLDYFYFLHALTSCYMRLPYVVYFYFGHALTMF